MRGPAARRSCPNCGAERASSWKPGAVCPDCAISSDDARSDSEIIDWPLPPVPAPATTEEVKFSTVTSIDRSSPGTQGDRSRFAMIEVPVARLGARSRAVLVITGILAVTWFCTQLLASHRRASSSADMADDWVLRLSRELPSAEEFRRRCREEADSLGADDRTALAAAARIKAIVAIGQVAAIDGPIPEPLFDQVKVRLDLGGCFFPDLLEQVCLLHAEQARRLGRTMSEIEIRECLARIDEALADSQPGALRDRLIREREQLRDEYGAIGGSLTGVIP